jgi:acetolactate synthase-1/2/3 large subunit
MNGAQIIMETAIQAGIRVCFANVGTTEMPLALAFDTQPAVRPILGLFEGVCTGAADGYGRMLERPAMTLLHLGPGLANGLANLHNAKRARAPIVNVIGEHMTRHVALDAPLTMDIEALAGTVSGWCKTTRSPGELSGDLADAISAARYGQIATLIVPNDVQLAQVPDDKLAKIHFAFDPADESPIAGAVQLLKGARRAALLIGGRGLRELGLHAAARIKERTGCDLLSDYLPGIMARGVGFPEITRIPYFPEQAVELLARYDAIVICGTKEPVSFFGYEGIPGRLLAEDQPRTVITTNRQDPVEALECLAEALGCPSEISPGVTAARRYPAVPQGKLTADKACQALAALQPEGAIIVDEGVSSAFAYDALSHGLPPHTMLLNSGGAIGYGLPCSIGAAIACPDRPVLNLQADGSAMYTVQALWTQARQRLNVTTLICANRSYGILKMEVARAGIQAIGPNLTAVLDIENPHLDWTKLAQAMGVAAVAVHTGEQLADAVKQSLEESGPHLIEMVL